MMNKINKYFQLFEGQLTFWGAIMPLNQQCFWREFEWRQQRLSNILFLPMMRSLLTSAETRQVGFWFVHCRKFACQLEHISVTFIQPLHWEQSLLVKLWHQEFCLSLHTFDYIMDVCMCSIFLFTVICHIYWLNLKPL